jgi:hypothetical protein
VQDLGNAHRVERQGDSFFRLETLVGKLVEPALNDADFFLVLVDVHPGFGMPDRVSADIARRTGFLFENAQAHGQKSGKEKRRRQSENKIPFDFCHELKNFPHLPVEFQFNIMSGTGSVNRRLRKKRFVQIFS